MYQKPAEGKKLRSGSPIYENSLLHKYVSWGHYCLCLLLAITAYRLGDEAIYGGMPYQYYIPGGKGDSFLLPRCWKQAN